MSNPFQKATKEQAWLRLAITGPSGAGKTYSALNIAQYLVDGAKVAVIDTEHGSASKYADVFEFDVVNLSDFRPAVYVQAIKKAQEYGYNVLVIDSLSHAWFAEGGVLDIVDKAAAKSKSGNTYMAWRDGTKEQNALIEAILQSSIHIIATMRSKMEYVLEVNDKGKQTPRKVGLAPIQRDNVEYEFDVVAEMDMDNTMIVHKSRCSALSGAVIKRPGEEVAGMLREWLTDGEPAKDEPTPKPQPEPTPEPEQASESKPEPAAKKRQSKPAPKNAVPYDPADDTRTYNQDIHIGFTGWLAKEQVFGIENAPHATQAVLISLKHVGALTDEQTIADLYGAGLSVADVYSAMVQRYNDKQAAA